MRKFTEDHDWVDAPAGGDIAVVGITSYAQEQLGDIVYVQLPEAGDVLEKGGVLATVESAKAASDIESPVSGTVLEVNDAVLSDCSIINRAPETSGWLLKIKCTNLSELDALLSQEAYQKHIS